MKNYILYFIIVFATVVFNLVSKILLNTDELLINSLVGQLTQEQIQDLLISQDKWEWLGYVIIPLLIVLKTSIIAAIIDIGCFFFEKEIKYSKLVNIVLKAELVFLVVLVFKTTWFYVFQQDYTLEDIQYFYPLSAINIVGYEGLQTWFIYPLQVINVFEMVYWFILAYLLGKELKLNTVKGFSIVASSYGVSLAIWVVAMMFINLNMS